ncbi:PGRS family protein [Polyangium jinanense]|uniref:PGRS family protein n=1 Tax=Polyangium jinanense TaxID=2829994 RepID=A0A9X4AX03_9BACT|nr:PGRS family protein [Polyangium jinanense]MDC3961477.1 PGRS family protein [Polyangium jinanense]MDC3987908.1 PGRS family protein [Polyangium jinanense]
MRRHSMTSTLAMLACAAGAFALGGCGLDVFADCSVTKTCAGQASSQTVCPLDGDPSRPASCGLYVAASGDDTNPGTAERPLRTLRAAVDKVQKQGARPIYACAETFIEPLALRGGEVLHGGYNCTGGSPWTTQVGMTTLSASANEVPLRVGAGGPTVVTNFKVVAADAVLPGASSIAVIADRAELELGRCHLEAGKGADGLAPTPEAKGATDGMPGKMGFAACTYTAVQEVSSTCGTVESIGGSGGFGTSPWGKAGRNSSLGKDVSGGQGGEPEGFTGIECTPGGPGAAGTTGAHGAHGVEPGTISVNGYEGASGTSGGEGTVGLAGGGGGAALGGLGVNKCPAGSATTHGASGGSGGTGGCGGKGGAGGGAGGGSFGLLCIDARISSEAVTIVTAGGGKGGDGAQGQAGGNGGTGGLGGPPPQYSPLKPGCHGGNGGNGGDGGHGGGGRGGHSIGIAYVGNAPAATGVSFEIGLEGPGGQGDDPQDPAPAGLRRDMESFD